MSIGHLPKPVLILEVLGILLLVLAYLSINDYVTLPPAIATATAAITMVFIGVALMVPAAVCLVWRAIDTINPQLMNGLGRDVKKRRDNASDIKEKRDDTDD